VLRGQRERELGDILPFEGDPVRDLAPENLLP
jgi:hypothetical protein